MEIRGLDSYYERKDEPFDIVQIGYVALEATRLTIERKRFELESRFSERFINNTEQFIKNNIIDLNKLVDDSHAYGARDLQPEPSNVSSNTGTYFYLSGLSDSGIFGGLWELAEKSLGCGIRINLNDILIRQETIEILELFDANPYTYPSAGTYIAAVINGHKYVRHLKESGYPAAVIGASSDLKDRIIINGDETRFLTPTYRLYKDEQEFNLNGVSLRKELK